MAEPRVLDGRYELGEVIGHGGMAKVYRARDIRLNRVVAVKTLSEDLANDETFQARFRREAQSAASLNHPSIIAVYDTGEDTDAPLGVPYIVMEYADGRTLHDLLRDGQRLRPDRALEITDGILRALEYSHRNGIVHRDIKPANVMLVRDGDVDGAVKVMDFGIARSESHATMTGTSQVLGTAHYLSPEQARGERVDARSDIYSAGCVLYEMLTGQPPFSGDSAVAIAYQHVRATPVPPSQRDPQLPGWADAIVLRAMAKSPADRYQNAAAMRAAIQRVRAGPPASPPDAQLPWQTPVRPAAAASQTAAIPSYRNGGAEPPHGSRRRAVLWALLGLVVVAAVIVAAYVVLAGGGGGGRSSYAVPAVSGLTQQQASAQIKAAHLRPQFIGERSQTVSKGRVIGTSPASGTLLAANSVVKVFVSTGRHRATVAVPGVVGDDVNTARGKLTNAGLQPVVKTDSTATGPANTVVRQDPPAGTEVSPDSTVTIYLPESGSQVQDVRGDPAATAKSILKGQGYQVAEIKRPGPPSAQPGKVYAQNPAAGTALAPGGTVTIYVQPASPQLAIVAAPPSLSVTQGSTGTFGVTLSAAPASEVTVTVSLIQGNSGLSVGAGGTLTFTPSNWNSAQDVTIAADLTGTGPATFTATATGYTAATVTATEVAGSSASPSP
jgi:serine/threonine-protein kinase